MECRCPACGRTTRIESQLLDFFTRCDRCGILLRPRAIASEMMGAAQAQYPSRLTAKVVPVGRVRQGSANVNGQLAELLSRPARATPVVRWEQAPAAASALRPSTPKRHRRHASRRALLQQHHHTLGIIGLCGSGLIAMLAVGVLSLKARTFFHPRADAPGIVHVDEGFNGGIRRSGRDAG